MDLIITPNGCLSGTVRINGSKNGALPMLAAAAAAEGTTVISGAPDVSDIRLMQGILTRAGARISNDGGNITVNSDNIRPELFAGEDAGKIRGSFLLAGACLSRFGTVKIAMPGGCPIGMRPIDLHIKGLAALGADVSCENGIVTLKAPRLCGTGIYLDFPSVGATENIMTAACTAEGETVISNASAEPEICSLASMLRAMGAHIEGAGTDRITVCGVKTLRGADVRVMPDRIEAGTYLALLAAVRGRGCLENVDCTHLTPVTAKLREMGAELEERENSIYIDASRDMHSADIKTLPYPGFPTDMQAQFCALLCTCEGSGMVVETVFENRFLHVGELIRMGASIKTDGRTAIVEGDKQLTGAVVDCRDLRGGAALMIAACAARGETVIRGAEHILRGYADMESKLAALGCVSRFVSAR